MKTLIVIIVLAIIALGAWALWPNNNNSTTVGLASDTPTPLDYTNFPSDTPLSTVAATPVAIPTKTPASTSAPVGQGGTAPQPVRAPVFATLNSVNGSSENGVAALTASNNDLAMISFNMANWPVGVTQKATIMQGTCANMGNESYGLNSLVNGTSTTILNKDFLDIAQSKSQLAIVVYGPDNASGIPYVCGQLR